MSTTLSGPALNASNADPGFTPPAAPPLNASNDPRDHAAGTGGEMSAIEQAAVVVARSGKDQADAPNPDGEQTPPATETKPVEPAETKPEAKPDDTPPAIKREITIERNRRREAETAATAATEARTAAEARLETALKALEALTPKPAEPSATDPRPARDTFDTPEAYEEALTGWAGRKAAAEATATAEAEFTKARQKEVADAQAANQAAERTQLETQWQAGKDKALEKYPDYEEVAGAEVEISPLMAEAMIRADNGHDIAYHLGKNPADAARIRALPTAAAQIFEMGKLAATLAQPPRIDVSRTPEPIVPLNGSREVATDTDREETMDEVAARVAKRERNGRTAMWGRPN